MSDVLKQIDEDVKKHPIIMYVKGNRMFPQCGFSKAVMDIFGQLEVPFETRDVLEDPAVRDGIKEYSNWPTIPQVYMQGKFVGGCDIVVEMYNKGELEPMAKQAAADIPKES